MNGPQAPRKGRFFFSKLSHLGEVDFWAACETESHFSFVSSWTVAMSQFDLIFLSFFQVDFGEDLQWKPQMLKQPPILPGIQQITTHYIMKSSRTKILLIQLMKFVTLTKFFRFPTFLLVNFFMQINWWGFSCINSALLTLIGMR